jgi:hypothetical protein
MPRSAAEAGSAGSEAVHALPPRLRGQTVGALNVFWTSPADIQLT